MRSARGFTLVELLVVISIIAILSVIGITIFSSAQKSARDARRRADLKAIANALEQYKITTGAYPVPGGNGWVLSSAEQPWIPGLNSNYMTSIPADPLNTGPAPYLSDGGFIYGYNSVDMNGAAVGSWFMLVAHLESPNSNDLKTGCTLPDGERRTAGVNGVYPNAFFVCSQQ